MKKGPITENEKHPFRSGKNRIVCTYKNLNSSSPRDAVSNASNAHALESVEQKSADTLESIFNKKK